MNELSNLDKIFNNKLFRVPDYQRGYAWQLTPQLTDFWEDINTLEDGKNHYTGVLSIAEVKRAEWIKWEDDSWIIESRGCTPYFVVDGQQRLTTCIILIQALLEEALKLPQNQLPNKNDFELCDTKISDIGRKFIVVPRSKGFLRSFVFGYDKNNPSYEYLKTKIFNEDASSNSHEETLYTRNLGNAKEFFRKNLAAVNEQDRLNTMESIYKKVTRNLLFNEYVIQSDVDVFVAFETMNNRGKKLSNLELLKNRLIYLTTLFHEDKEEKTNLRKHINNSWKEVYYQLGRNKDKALNDDDFLKDHFVMYFKYSRRTGDDYIHFLLTEEFTPKKIIKDVPIVSDIQDPVEVRDNSYDELNDEEDTHSATQKSVAQSIPFIELVCDYAKSIRDSSSHWFYTFNPWIADLTTEEKKWLDCLNRIGIGYFRPLVMSSFCNKKVNSSERIRLFKSIERFIFIAFRLSQQRGNYRRSEFHNTSRDLYYGVTDVDTIEKSLNDRLEFTFNEDGTFKLNSFQDFISNKFKYGSKKGFYDWPAIRYFLYEYEQDLFEQSKSQTRKISWDTFTNPGDMVSIEHILPRTPDKTCWQDSFSQYSKEQLSSLTNTLGNLLALSQPKNSSLQNDCYAAKCADEKTKRGYFNGSYSENLVAKSHKEWTAEQIKSRSLELLSFMEKRWKIELGDKSTKLRLLNIDFLEEVK